jgi:hypothetical protein
MHNLMKIACLSLAAIALTGVSSNAQVVVGSWQTASDDGWIDWGNQSVGLYDASNAGKYSIATSAVTGYAQSLQITQAGYNQGLSLKLENTPGDVAAFLNNTLLSFTFSVPAAADSGATAGYSQLYALSINATGYGFHDQSLASLTATGDTANNSGGQPNFYFYSGAGVRSQTVTLDYSSILPSITATPSSGYIELIFSFNNGGGAPANFFMNNVTLSSVPEPTTGVLALAGGIIALVFVRRRTKQAA